MRVGDLKVGTVYISSDCDEIYRVTKKENGYCYIEFLYLTKKDIDIYNSYFGLSLNYNSNYTMEVDARSEMRDGVNKPCPRANSISRKLYKSYKEIDGYLVPNLWERDEKNKAKQHKTEYVQRMSKKV